MSTIELKDISYRYEDGTEGLNHVDLSLDKGKCYCLKGPNGCGKSTLFRILNGLSFPTEGHYFFDGTEITAAYLHNKKNASAFHSRIGFLFQDTEVMLFTGSVEDEIAFGLYQMGLDDEEVHNRTEHYISALSLEHLRKKAPFNLSGGEKKRTALAVVLAMEPDVIIMDEPLSGLDEDGQKWICDTLTSLKSHDRLMLIATHNDELIGEIADETILMNRDHQIFISRP